MTVKHVAGENRGSVMLYALSTCGWCKKTKALLNEMNVAYDYLDVDLLEKAQKQETLEEVKKWNPACSFPSIVVNGRQCIVGFNEPKIREALMK
jgi:glutaredoxin-like protein NrdH